VTVVDRPHQSAARTRQDEIAGGLAHLHAVDPVLAEVMLRGIGVSRPKAG